jgi:hypothetical protein
MRGTPRGRPPKLTEDDLEAARALLANADIPVTAIVHRSGRHIHMVCAARPSGTASCGPRGAKVCGFVRKAPRVGARASAGATPCRDPGEPGSRGEHLEREDSEEAARRLGITIRYLPVHKFAELDAAFPALAAGEPEALVVFPDPVTVRRRQRIIDFAETRHLPVISAWAIFAQSEALCTYGPRLTESYKRAAYHVDRIIKGERPGLLSIEQPTRFELVVNLKTANALGLTVPRTILARADEVIE